MEGGDVRMEGRSVVRRIQEPALSDVTGNAIENPAFLLALAKLVSLPFFHIWFLQMLAHGYGMALLYLVLQGGHVVRM